MFNRLLRPLALALALTALAACGGESSSDQYPAIDHRDLISLISESKAKVTLVNFWATWCPSCRQELEVLAKLRQVFSPEELNIIGVSVDQTVAPVQSFFGADKPAYPVYMGNQEVAQAFLVQTIPKLMAYGDKGTLALNHVGYLELDELAALVRKIGVK